MNEVLDGPLHQTEVGLAGQRPNHAIELQSSQRNFDAPREKTS